MKIFLLNIFKISGLFGLFIITIFAFFNVIILQKAIIKTNPKVKYIVLGHSHPECAYNDSIIVGFSNYAASGESYFFTYCKSKLINKAPNNIQVVFIEFTNNQLSESMDKWIWGSKFLNDKFVFYAPFINLPDYKILITNNLRILSEALPIFIKKNAFYFITNNYDYNRLGKYRYLVRNKTDSLLVNLPSTNMEPLTNTEPNDRISEMHLKYLERLIQFWKNKYVKVYLIRSPLHEKYEGYSNEKVFQGILNTRFKHTEFLDFSKFPLTNTEFGDLEHLNYKGAKKYSIWFNKVLSVDSILYKTNKQEFINSEMDKLKRANL